MKITIAVKESKDSYWWMLLDNDEPKNNNELALIDTVEECAFDGSEDFRYPTGVYQGEVKIVQDGEDDFYLAFEGEPEVLWQLKKGDSE